MDDLDPIPVEERPAPPKPPPRNRGSLAVLVVVAVLGLQVAVFIRVGDLRDTVRSLEKQAGVQANEVLRLASRLRTVEETLSEMNEIIRPIVVPDVIGLHLATAQEQLRRHGLRSSVVDGDPIDPESRVTAQEPGAGSAVPRDATVGLRTMT